MKTIDLEKDPRDMTDDELRADIAALESRLYTLKAEGSKIWRLRLRTNNAIPADRVRLNELLKRRGIEVKES